MHNQTHREHIAPGLSEDLHPALQELIEVSNRHDGYDFPLEVSELPAAIDGLPTTLVYTVDGAVLGFVSIYNWFDIELYGLVHPAYRRQGIGRALFAVASAMARQYAPKKLLLGCCGSLPAALAFAEEQQATFDHADYHMQLDVNAIQRPATWQAELTLRQAQAGEFAQIAALAAQAFPEPEEELRDWLAKDIVKSERRTFFIELQGQPVGTIRLVGGLGERAEITLFSLLPSSRGHGYGRQILLTSVDLLLAEQSLDVSLDVTTTNSNALALYRSCGFQEMRKDSYYKLMLV